MTPLTPDEQRLIACYRNLKEDEKRHLVGYAELMMLHVEGPRATSVDLGKG